MCTHYTNRWIEILQCMCAVRMLNSEVHLQFDCDFSVFLSFYTAHIHTLTLTVCSERETTYVFELLFSTACAYAS